jgi:hypothetical protein
MIHLLITCHVPNFSGSLVIAMTPKDKENFRSVAMLLQYILRKYYSDKNCIFFQDSSPHIISEPYKSDNQCRYHLTLSACSPCSYY